MALGWMTNPSFDGYRGFGLLNQFWFNPGGPKVADCPLHSVTRGPVRLASPGCPNSVTAAERLRIQQRWVTSDAWSVRHQNTIQTAFSLAFLSNRVMQMLNGPIECRGLCSVLPVRRRTSCFRAPINSPLRSCPLWRCNDWINALPEKCSLSASRLSWVRGPYQRAIGSPGLTSVRIIVLVPDYPGSAG